MSAVDQPPVPPEFKLGKLRKVAYAMSIAAGAVGQILFLGSEFGGEPWHYAAASGLAAFAEFVMASSGDASLEHRAEHRAWKLMLGLGVTVACYAASMQLLHFWDENRALAATFAGASVAGFALHVLDGHIRVAAYLRDLEVWERRQADKQRPEPVKARPRPGKVVVPADPPAERVPEPRPEPQPAVEPPVPPVPPVEPAGAAPEPHQAVPSNVTPITKHHEDGRPRRKKDIGRDYFREQVLVHRRRPEDISTREIDQAAGANGMAKDYKARWIAELAAEQARVVGGE